MDKPTTADTDSQELARALRESEERFRRVVEYSPSAMIMIDARGCIEMVNIQAEQLFGYERAAMLGQSIEMLLPDRFRSQHPQLREAFFSEPRSRPMGVGRDLYARRRDGSEFPVEIGLNPIATTDGHKVLSAIVDISDRKQKEMQVRAALQEKELLLGEIHHRVKNNLQVVDSLLDLQASRLENDQLRDILRDSQNRIRSMAMIHQTLYQSHDFARVDFSDIVDSLIPALVTSYNVDPTRIRVDLHADTVNLPINFAIPCGLIINELVTNSFKYAFPADRKGVISVTLQSTAEDLVELSVGDDGVGLPPQQEMHRGDTLGLQLVQLLAGQVGGELDIQRRPAHFTLRFNLPARRETEVA